MPDFATTYDELMIGIQKGLHTGGQICILLGDTPVLDISFGHDGYGNTIESDSLMLWLSAGKPVTAVAILQLWEKGLLDLNDPVARHIPEFATSGKGGISIWHLLTHTGGFRFFDEAWYRLEWDEIIQKICASRPEPRWIPGRLAGYHPASSWFILGDIIQRITGRPISEYVWLHILEPAGMLNTRLGIPEEDMANVEGRVVRLWDTSTGQPRLSSNDTNIGLHKVLPASGFRGQIRDLAAFYRHLLTGKVLTSQPTSLAMASRQRCAMSDRTFQSVIDWGLGVMVNSYHYSGTYPYSFGEHASPRAFGHGGAQCAMAFADPEFDLVVAWAVNGAPGETAHQMRQERINSAIYRDLQISWYQNME